MKTYYHNGSIYDIPDEKVSDFLRSHPGAEPTIQYRRKNETYDIPVSKKDSFLKTYADAIPTRGSEQPAPGAVTTRQYNPENDPIRKNLEWKPPKMRTPEQVLAKNLDYALNHPNTPPKQKPIPGGALEKVDRIQAENKLAWEKTASIMDPAALGAGTGTIKAHDRDIVKAVEEDKAIKKRDQDLQESITTQKTLDDLQEEYHFNDLQLLDYAERRTKLSPEEENDMAHLLKRQAYIENNYDRTRMGMSKRAYLNYQVGAEMRKEEPVLSYLDAIGTGSLALFTSPYNIVNPGGGLADFIKYGQQGSMSVGGTFGNIVQATLASTPLNVMMMVAPELAVPLSFTQVTADNIKNFYDTKTLDTTAVISSVLSGAVQTAIEFASDSSQVGKYRSAYREAGKEGLEAALKRDLKDIFSPTLNQTKTAVFKGTITEGLEEVAQNLSDKIINHVINDDPMPEDLGQYAKELALDFVGGAFGGFVMGAGASGINLVTHRNMMDTVNRLANGENPYESVKLLQNAIIAIKEGDMAKAKTDLAKAKDMNATQRVNNRHINQAYALATDAINAWDTQRTVEIMGQIDQAADRIQKNTSELNALKREAADPDITSPEGKRAAYLEALIEEDKKLIKDNYKVIAADKDMTAVEEAVTKAIIAEKKLDKLKKNPNPSNKTQRKIDKATAEADILAHEANVAINKASGSLEGEYDYTPPPVTQQKTKTQEQPSQNPTQSPTDRPLTEEERAQQIKDGTYVPTEEERAAMNEKIELAQSKGMMAGDVNDIVDRTDPKETDTSGTAEYGNEVNAKIPKGKRVKVRYVLVPRKSLVVSHDNDFKENPAYPAEIQNRDRGKASNKEQVLNIEANLDPMEVMDSYIAKDGAPIVIRDKQGNWIVMGGNGRMMGINRRAELRGPESMKEYEETVKSRLGEFGFDPETDTTGKVLVRVYYGDDDMVEMATKLNTDTGQRISPAERASSDATEIANARRKGNDILKLLNITGVDVMSKSNEAFVQAFYDLIVKKESGEFLTSNGDWTTMLRTRIEMALFAYMNNASNEAERLLESFYEAGDSRVKNIVNGIINNIQVIVKLRSLIEEHNLLDLDISQTLTEAAARIDELRKKGHNIESLLEDADMFSEGQSLIPEEEKPLYRVLYGLRSKKEATEFIASYYAQAIEAISPEEMTILSGTAKSREQFLMQSVEEWINESAERKAEKERQRRAGKAEAEGDNQGDEGETATPQKKTPGSGDDQRLKQSQDAEDDTGDSATDEETIIPDQAAENALIGLFKNQVESTRKGDPQKGEDPRTLYIKFKNGNELVLNRKTGLITATDPAGNFIGHAIGVTNSQKTITGNIRVILDLVDHYNGGNRTLFHEAFHVAWKIFLTAEQQGYIIKHYAKTLKKDLSNLSPADMVDIEEAAADDASDWLGDRADNPKGFLGNIWRRFWDRIRHALVSLGYYPSKMAVHDIFRQMESGTLSGTGTEDIEPRYARLGDEIKGIDPEKFIDLQLSKDPNAPKYYSGYIEVDDSEGRPVHIPVGAEWIDKDGKNAGYGLKHAAKHSGITGAMILKAIRTTSPQHTRANDLNYILHLGNGEKLYVGFSKTWDGADRMVMKTAYIRGRDKEEDGTPKTKALDDKSGKVPNNRLSPTRLKDSIIDDPKKSRFKILGINGVSNLYKGRRLEILKNNLDIAKAMHMDGYSNRGTRLATGWEIGIDSKWRYELPDRSSLFIVGWKATIKGMAYEDVEDNPRKIAKILPHNLTGFPKIVIESMTDTLLERLYTHQRRIDLKTGIAAKDLYGDREFTPDEWSAVQEWINANLSTLTPEDIKWEYVNHLGAKKIAKRNARLWHTPVGWDGEFYETTLSKIYKDAELYKAYPELKDYRVVFHEMVGAGGYFSWIDHTIAISIPGDGYIRAYVDKNTHWMKMTIMHEVQHYIQAKEGFAFGGSAGDLTDHPATEKNITAFEKYMRLVGEVEARNVATRNSMFTPQYLKDVPLEDTEDRDRDVQLFRNSTRQIQINEKTVELTLHRNGSYYLDPLSVTDRLMILPEVTQNKIMSAPGAIADGGKVMNAHIEAIMQVLFDNGLINWLMNGRIKSFLNNKYDSIVDDTKRMWRYADADADTQAMYDEAFRMLPEHLMSLKVNVPGTMPVKPSPTEKDMKSLAAFKEKLLDIGWDRVTNKDLTRQFIDTLMTNLQSTDTPPKFGKRFLGYNSPSEMIEKINKALNETEKEYKKGKRGYARDEIDNLADAIYGAATEFMTAHQDTRRYKLLPIQKEAENTLDMMYSIGKRHLMQKLPKRFTKEMLTNIVNKEIREEDALALGLETFIEGAPETITKEELIAWIDKNEFQIEVNTLSDENNQQQYERWITGFGKNYREYLFRSMGAEDYTAPHFGIRMGKNMIMHMRLSDYTESDLMPIEDIPQILFDTDIEDIILRAYYRAEASFDRQLMLAEKRIIRAFIKEWSRNVQKFSDHNDPKYDALQETDFDSIADQYNVGRPKLTKSGIEKYRKILRDFVWGKKSDIEITHNPIIGEITYKPGIIIEEMQSDYHQKARRRGYRDKKDASRIAQIKAKLNSLYRENGYYQDDSIAQRRTDPASQLWADLLTKEKIRDGETSHWIPLTDKSIAELRRLLSQTNALEEELERIENANNAAEKMPNIPTKKFQEFLFKFALIESAKKGYGDIYWTTGAEQADRYGDPERSTRMGDGLAGFYDDIVVRYANKLGKKYGTKADTVMLAPSIDGEREFPLEFNHMTIPPEMRDDILRNGMPRYKMLQSQEQEAQRQMEEVRAKYIDNPIKYYNSHGKTYTWKEAIETEVEERGNYSAKDFSTWAKKYGIAPSDQVIWVTPNKAVAHTYSEDAGDRDDILGMSPEELSSLSDVHEFDSTQGFIIPESDDGDEGYLFVFRPTQPKMKPEYLKAPNGKPTKLTERQWLQVRTPAFKAWFGDWENDPKNASKVIDENGEPRIVYHGTNTDFYEFRPGDTKRGGNFGPGIYFSDSKDDAEIFAKAEGTPRIIEAFLNIRSPYQGTATNNNAWVKPLLEDREWIEKNFDGAMVALKKQDDRLDREEFIVYSPSQIKSATDNVGTFNPESNDIRYKLLDEETYKKLEEMPPLPEKPWAQYIKPGKIDMVAWREAYEKGIEPYNAALKQWAADAPDFIPLKSSYGYAIISLDPSREDDKRPWRATWFTNNMEPAGHTLYATKLDAVKDTVEDYREFDPGLRFKLLDDPTGNMGKELEERLKAAKERLERTKRDPLVIAEEVAEEMGLEPEQVKEKLGKQITAAYREGEAKVSEAMAAMQIAFFDEFVAANKPEETDRSDLTFHWDEAEAYAASIGISEEEVAQLGADGYTFYTQGLNMFAYGNGLLRQLTAITQINEENRQRGIVDLQSEEDERKLTIMTARAVVGYRMMKTDAARLLSHARKEKNAQIRQLTHLAAALEEDQMQIYRDLQMMQEEQKELQKSIDEMDAMISELEKQYEELMTIIARMGSRQKMVGTNELIDQAEKLKNRIEESKAKRDEMMRRMILLKDGMDNLINQAKVTEEQIEEVKKVIPRGGKPKKPPRITEIKLVKPTAWDIARAIFYQNILSSPATHARNLIGNEINLQLENLVNIVTGRELRSVFASIASIPAAAKAAVRTFKDKKPDAKDAMESRAFQDAAEYLVKYDLKGSMSGKIMKQLTYVTRALAAEDAFFYRRGFGAQLVSLAIEESRRTGKDVQSLINEPTIEMLTQIRYEAKRATFNYEPEGILGALVKGIETSIGIMEQLGTPGRAAALLTRTQVIPFTKVVANVFNAGLDWTPLGFLGAIKYAGLVDEEIRLGGKNKYRQRNIWVDEKGNPVKSPYASRDIKRQLFRATMGTIAMVMMQALLKGLISGGGPKDKEERKQMIESGWKPYSINVNGQWIPYATLPISPALAAIANYNEAQTYNDRRAPISAEDRLATSIMGISSTILDKSFLSGVSGLLNALARGDKNYLKKTVGQTPGTFLSPNLLRFIGDAIYRDAHAPETTAQFAIYSLRPWTNPWLKKTVPTQIDVLGNTPKKPYPWEGIIGSPVDNDEPIWVADKNNIPSDIRDVVKALNRGGYKIPGATNYKIKVRDEDGDTPAGYIQLSGFDKMEYQKIRGREISLYLLDYRKDILECTSPGASQDDIDWLEKTISYTIGANSTKRAKSQIRDLWEAGKLHNQKKYKIYED